MQHDSQYPSSRQQERRTVADASKVFGTLVAWALIGLVGVLVGSGLIALIVMLWRVIL